MKRVRPILTAACAVLLFLGCSSREVLVTKAVDLGFEIEQVTGTKIIFTVNPDNQDASYIFCCIPEEHPDYELSDRDAALHHLDYLNRVSEKMTGGEVALSFSDNFCYRGSRRLKIDRLSRNTLFRILIFQVNPKTHAIIGNVISEQVRTKDVPMKPLSFTITGKEKTLFISPSDPELTYFWSFDRVARIEDNYDNTYSFLYYLLDMYEDYGFAEHVLSKGDIRYQLPPNQLWEGEEYCICAIGYEDGEIISDETEWRFIYRNGSIIPE